MHSFQQRWMDAEMISAMRCVCHSVSEASRAIAMPGKSVDMIKLSIVLACAAGALMLSVPAYAGPRVDWARKAQFAGDKGLAGDMETRGLMVGHPGSISYPVTIPRAADGSPATKCDSEGECVLVASSYGECGWLEGMGLSNDAASECDLNTAVWKYCNALWPGRDPATFAERNTCDDRLSSAAGFYKWYFMHLR